MKLQEIAQLFEKKNQLIELGGNFFSIIAKMRLGSGDQARGKRESTSSVPNRRPKSARTLKAHCTSTFTSAT